MNKILKLTLVLFLICAIVAAVLGVVNEVTKDRIAAIQAEKTRAAYNTVLRSDFYKDVDMKPYTEVANGQKIKIDSIAEAGNGSGYVVQTTFSGAQGNITMVVGVNKAGKGTGISIIKHSETSGLGANAASTAEVGVNFRSQFVGQGGDVALKKSGGEIDALSGATITSTAVTKAVAASIEAVSMLG